MSIQDKLELIKLGIRSLIFRAKLRIRSLLFSHMQKMEMLERQVRQLEDQMSSVRDFLETDKLAVTSLLNSRFWKYDVRFYVHNGKAVSLYALDLNSEYLLCYPITWDLAHKILRTPSDTKAAKMILDTKSNPNKKRKK